MIVADFRITIGAAGISACGIAARNSASYSCLQHPIYTKNSSLLFFPKLRKTGREEFFIYLLLLAYFTTNLTSYCLPSATTEAM